MAIDVMLHAHYTHKHVRCNTLNPKSQNNTKIKQLQNKGVTQTQKNMAL